LEAGIVTISDICIANADGSIIVVSEENEQFSASIIILQPSGADEQMMWKNGVVLMIKKSANV
jgi:hypothetical protein